MGWCTNRNGRAACVCYTGLYNTPFLYPIGARVLMLPLYALETNFQKLQNHRTVASRVLSEQFCANGRHRWLWHCRLLFVTPQVGQAIAVQEEFVILALALGEAIVWQSLVATNARVMLVSVTGLANSFVESLRGMDIAINMYILCCKTCTYLCGLVHTVD